MKFIALIALMVAAPAFAATTGTLLLKGTVPAVLSITVTPTTLAANLPLDTTQSNGHVADINARWNTLNGARVSVSSANAGTLVHDSISSSSMAYTLTVPGVGTFSVATPQSFDAAIAGPQNQNAALGINYTGVPHENLVEGNYSDTLTFTITSL